MSADGDGSTDGAPGRVLVVDDNRLNRRTLARGVELEGHWVQVAEDGAEALEVLRSEPIDAVLLDIVMPGMDGFAVLEAVQADPQLREIPVIVVSAVDELDSAVRCIEMGAIDFLSKPVNPVLLSARLRTSLQRKRLADLQRAYLEQEMTLRQNEKLATLGRLSAGVAHELNNPAAAAVRGAEQLRQALVRLQDSALGLSRCTVSDADLAWLGDREGPGREAGHALDPLARSDAEDAVASWLASRGIARPRELAPGLLAAGLGVEELDEAAGRLEGAALEAALRWEADRRAVERLIDEVGQGASRVAEIVGALKSYAFLDRGLVQDVDLRRGLEDTLVMLRSRLADVAVRREYADDLPHVSGFGGELNQVWTNLVDNALHAMGARGTLTVRAYPDGGEAVVEVEDDGPGIPAEVLPTVFDPFVTTKPPGEGTGLGLNISHSIVVQRHSGRIEVASEPGRTVFTVRLPTEAASHS